MTATLCGNRFGRALLRPGGVRFDVAPAAVDDLCRRLDQARMTLAATGPLQALSRLPGAAHAAITGKLTLRPPDPVERLEDVQAVARAVEESQTSGDQS